MSGDVAEAAPAGETPHTQTRHAPPRSVALCLRVNCAWPYLASQRGAGGSVGERGCEKNSVSVGKNGAARRRAGTREAGVDAASAPVVPQVVIFKDVWRLPGHVEREKAGTQFEPKSTLEGEAGMERGRAQCRDGGPGSGGGICGGGKQGRVSTRNSRPSTSVGERVPAHSEAGQSVAVRNFTA